MNPISPVFAILIYLIAFTTAYLINLKYQFANNSGRFESIDGLRGFLAIGVFIYHSAVWYQYLHTKNWESPNSNLLNHLGKTSVAFFFMITAFLFITKIIHARDKKMDWSTFFVNRFFRLVPMYLVSIVALILIVLIISEWKLNVTYTRLLQEIICWSTFTIIGSPQINGSAFTGIINAGVVWSLPYEWLFYFSLPTLSLFILHKKQSILHIIISIIFVLIYYIFNDISLHHILSFVGGGIAAFLLQYGPQKIQYNNNIFSVIGLLCLGLALCFPTPMDYICKLLLIVVFNLIVLGNTVFGILKNPALKLLGEICYSTYLIHGIIIFITMYFYYGFEQATALTPTEFCFTIVLLTPIIVIASFLSYKNIEKPFMDYSKRIGAERKNDDECQHHADRKIL